MVDYFNKKEISQRAEDELLYEYVMEEMEQEPNYIKGLWAKAMAHSEGNNEKTKSLYMQYRVQSIKDDFKLLEIAYNELSKEKLWDTIKNSFGNDEEKQKIKQEQAQKRETEKYGKIRGWLIFFAISLILGDLSYLQIFTFFTDDMKNTLETLYLNSQESIAKTINISVYTMIIGFFLNILLTVVFFSKSKYIKPIIITFLLFQIVAGFVNAGMTMNLQKEFPDLLSSRDFVMEVIMRPTVGTVFLLIWMFYFIYSKRVKKTFTNEKNVISAILWALVLPIILLFTYTSRINDLSDNYSLSIKAIKLGNENFNNNDTNQARVYYDRAIKLVSNSKSEIIDSKYEIIKLANEIADKYFDKKDYDNAIYFYRIAASKNDNKAKFRLAYSYDKTKKYSKAIKYYLQYIEKEKDEGAMFNLASTYASINDYKNAQKWYKQSFDICIKKARNGDKVAMKKIYFMYLTGHGTKQNVKKAIYWLNKAK